VITYVEESLFSSPAQTLVNTVNTVGVMGKGLARTFKTIYPEMFADYARRCETGELTIGRLLLYRTPHKWALNFPTKRHWRQPSRLEDIEAGLQTFRDTYAEHGITSIAFPQLGCGNGGLDWEEQVRPLMERYLSQLLLEVYIYINPGATSGADDLDLERTINWLQGDPRVLAFDAFVADLMAAVADGRATSWGGGDVPDSWQLRRSGQATVRRDSLFDLWHRLRSFGYLLPEDVTASLSMPAEPVFELLASLPYVTRSRVSRAPSTVGYDAGSTRAMLDAPEAQGVRIVPPLFAERLGESPLADQDDIPWSASRTTSQLALFSTN
jgi:O-acetyl-ADP-ribose deacetylase (regulator of RNase III)